MAFNELKPTASNHDGREISGGSVAINDTDITITSGAHWFGGYVDASAYRSLYPGNVTQALFRIKAISTSFDDPIIDVYMEDADSPAVFTTTSSSISSRPRTTNFTAVSVGSIGTGFYDIDITIPFQDAVNRAGWAGGAGGLVVVVDGKASSNLRFYAFDNGSDYWQIDVTYTAAGGQPTIARARQVPGMRRGHGRQGW